MRRRRPRRCTACRSSRDLVVGERAVGRPGTAARTRGCAAGPERARTGTRRTRARASSSSPAAVAQRRARRRPRARCRRPRTRGRCRRREARQRRGTPRSRRVPRQQRVDVELERDRRRPGRRSASSTAAAISPTCADRGAVDDDRRGAAPDRSPGAGPATRREVGQLERLGERVEHVDRVVHVDRRGPARSALRRTRAGRASTARWSRSSGSSSPRRRRGEHVAELEQRDVGQAVAGVVRDRLEQAREDRRAQDRLLGPQRVRRPRPCRRSASPNRVEVGRRDAAAACTPRRSPSRRARRRSARRSRWRDGEPADLLRSCAAPCAGSRRGRPAARPPRRCRSRARGRGGTSARPRRSRRPSPSISMPSGRNASLTRVGAELERRAARSTRVGAHRDARRRRSAPGTRRSASGATRAPATCGEQLDARGGAGEHAVRIDAPLEARARLGAQAEPLRRRRDAHRLEVRRLEQDLGRAVVHLGLARRP